MATILVLGAAGRLARVAAEAFRDAGWTVKGQVRPGGAGRLPPGVVPVEADGTDAEALAAAARGADVVLQGLNPPYTAWRTEVPKLTAAAIAAARASGGLLLFPGNVYGFGAEMPAVLTPETPERPTTVKGRLRVEAEAALAAGARSGAYRLAVIRAGDFYGGPGRGSWFDLVVAKDAARGLVASPARDLDMPHAWAYLPDLARAFVAVAEARDRLGPVETFHFAGHTLSMREIAAAVGLARGKPARVRRLPWWALRLAGLVMPMPRELVEMKYLWDVPHRLEDPRLESLAGPLPATPPDRAVADALRAIGALS
jgi:nucleoside-diphosphate-sugar epimerase